MKPVCAAHKAGTGPACRLYPLLTAQSGQRHCAAAFRARKGAQNEPRGINADAGVTSLQVAFIGPSQ